MDIGTVTSNAVSSFDTKKTSKKTEYGKTVGEPKLSEEGKKYYEKLKEKYKNLDFVLVSKDMKDTAKQNAASFGNAQKLVVLIDEEKIEKMATDSEFRQKYEQVIANASTKLPELKSAFDDMANVKSFGMQVDDGGNASFFAVVKKSQDAQLERIQEKRAEKKEAERKEAKKAAKEKLEEAKEEKKAKVAKEAKDLFGDVDDDTVVISATSVEELVSKVKDYTSLYSTSNVLAPEEAVRGGNFDMKL